MRILFWLGLLVLIILALKKKMQPPRSPVATTSRSDPQNPASAEAMVCCAHCQIYLPASEAVQRGEQVYCSKEHADLA